MSSQNYTQAATHLSSRSLRYMHHNISKGNIRDFVWDLENSKVQLKFSKQVHFVFEHWNAFFQVLIKHFKSLNSSKRLTQKKTTKL